MPFEQGLDGLAVLGHRAANQHADFFLNQVLRHQGLKILGRDPVALRYDLEMLPLRVQFIHGELRPIQDSLVDPSSWPAQADEHTDFYHRDRCLPLVRRG
jgi:hypothetical protein